MKKIWLVIASDDGAVTVDWLVLTAGIIGLTMFAFNSMLDGTLSFTDAVIEYLSNWDFS
mgnify:FL=1